MPNNIPSCFDNVNIAQSSHVLNAPLDYESLDPVFEPSVVPILAVRSPEIVI